MSRPRTFLLLSLLLLAGTAGASLLRPVTLPQLVERADEILVGTVLSIECYRGDPPRRLIYTDVTFDHLLLVKGPPRASVLYRFAGGTLGRRTLVVEGIPTFAPGERWLLFAAPGGDPLCDAVGWEQGCFRVRTDSETGAEMVTTAGGAPVYGFAKGRPVLDPSAETERPLGPEKFLELVRAEMSLQEATEEREEEE